MKVRLHISPTSKKRGSWSRIVGQVKNALNCSLIIEVGCSPTQRFIGGSRTKGYTAV